MDERLKITFVFARRYLGNRKSYRDKWKSVLKGKVPRFWWSSIRWPEVIIFRVIAVQSFSNFKANDQKNLLFVCTTISREPEVVSRWMKKRFKGEDPALLTIVRSLTGNRYLAQSFSNFNRVLSDSRQMIFNRSFLSTMISRESYRDKLKSVLKENVPLFRAGFFIHQPEVIIFGIRAV